MVLTQYFTATSLLAIVVSSGDAARPKVSLYNNLMQERVKTKAFA